MEQEGIVPMPSSPGVYIFRDATGSVLYIGKSRNLKRRVLDHLHVRSEKDALIADQYSKVEFVPTHSEREALLLEASLIREYRPRYNVLLKDDRSYPYIQVTTGEKFPRVFIVRRPSRSKAATLFGPYTGAREARNLVHFVEDTFHVRRCRKLPKRACIYYHMGQCPAPCIGAISEADYGALVDRSLMVLRGRGRELVPHLESEMRTAASKEEYERAAVLRDSISAIGNLRERQRVMNLSTDDMDVLAVHLPEDRPNVAVIGVLKVRDGQVVRAEPHAMSIPEGIAASKGEILSDYLLQNYAQRPDIPGTLYVPALTEDEESDADETMGLLRAERGLTIKPAVTGKPRSLMDLALKAASTHAHSRDIGPGPSESLSGLKDLLSLPTTPRVIEGVDISILQGKEPVGSLVHFLDGLPDKSEYRRFKIKTVEGTDDFAMIHEVVGRRLRRLRDEGKSLPDLLLIDGGAIQVAKAAEALDELGLKGRVPIVGLAKREEELYLPGVRAPLKPDKNSPPMLLLRRVRDESHRFAVTYHRKRRQMALRKELADAP